MLTDSKIKAEAAMTSSYTRGNQYFREAKVRGLQYDKRANRFEARVVGGHKYFVFIEFDEENEIEVYHCDCQAYFSYDGACKHIIAVLKAIQTKWGQYFSQSREADLTNSTKALLTYFNNDPSALQVENRQTTTKIVPTYCIAITATSKRSWLEFAIGSERTYVMKDITKFLQAVSGGYELEYGKNFVFKPREAIFDEKSLPVYEFLRMAYIDEKQLASWGYYSNYASAFEDKKFKLNNTNILKFFEIMGENSFSMSVNDEKMSHMTIINSRPPFKLDVKAISFGVKMALDLEDDVYYGLDNDLKYIYHKGFIYKVDDVFSNNIRPLLRCFGENKKPEIIIPTVDVPEFFSTVVPAFEKMTEVNVDNSLSRSFYREQLEKQIYFDRFEQGVMARIAFKYGEISLNPGLEKNQKSEEFDGKKLLRATVEENRVLGLFKKYGFELSGGVFVQRDEEATYSFLKAGLPELVELAEVFYSDDFKNIKIKSTGRVSAGVKLNAGTGMLEMSLQYEDMDPKELIELLSAYKLKKKYHRMKNGTFIPLDSSEFQNAAELVEQLGISHADISKKIIELPKYRAMYVDSLARDAGDFHIERNSAFKKMVQDVQEPQDMEYEIPEGIEGKLRDYQKIGFKWLKSLSHYGFGGILADDMGLGKTLQVIAFVLSEKSVGEDMPSLVIAPTSLVYNWREEVRKFVPSLKIAVISGQQAERLEQLKEVVAADIVVTSYGMMKRDIELYESMEFKYCFIDEAQHIKNPNTLNAKAVKRIKARGYFALTGTPIENTLTELWSIFDFLMPGYLLTHNKFITRYEKPIVKNSDSKALKDLARHIKPFIIRRMKKDVLKELPEKIESKMSNEMTSEQAKIYSAYLMKAKKEFESEIQANGFEKSQIKILSILTRLRQICCHPSLFIENYKGGSGKLEMLMEILEDAVGGGHRILLFSQFTSMLSLIKKELDATSMKYHYLDGSTKAEDRLSLVNSFNSGEKDIFLISLKAGGTGLNLTGADMVIHYDPWWNPAVEDQATDRAYRIGQKNVVQVFKFITKDTLEEKIYELQQKKKELIDVVIQPGENFLTKMSEGEIRKLFE